MVIRIGIYGYGNLGKGVECALRQQPDMELAGIFTRRDPKTVHSLTDAPVYPASEAESFRDRIDVMIVCGGSATDLPVLTGKLAGTFSVVDSFDTHAFIPEHFANVDSFAKKAGTVALISGGWDPGVFSLMRLYGDAFLPDGQTDTFWGPGVSQGHSDAVRRI
ncbi:MAG: diaminopimelate dehydrogenase, partial [Clostridia bacterium]|nr:diaminopimelate dehydrogenase [Clostridia bacterium]